MLIEVVRLEIVKTGKVREGAPPSCYSTYRRYVVAMSVSRGPLMLRSVLDMSTLPNGNWLDDTLVEIWIPVGTPYVEQELLQTVADRMIRAMFPGLFTLLSKDISFRINWVGLIA